MDKKALAKIPLRDASPETISQAMRIETVETYISAEVVPCGDKKVLLLNLYLKCDLKAEITRAAYRVFIDDTDYITQDMKSKGIKWLTGRLCFILDTWHLNKRCACTDDVSYQTIAEYFKSSLHPFTAIANFQNVVLERRLAVKHKKITDRIDAKMALLPELPGDWEEWLEKIAMPNSRYIFYDYKKGKDIQQGRCTYCNSSVEINKPRYGKEAICPKCGTKVICKSSVKAGRMLPDWGQAAIIQRIGDNEIVLRCFRLIREHFPGKRKRSKTTAQEVSRDFFDPDKVTTYEWRKFLSTQNIRWCEGSQLYYIHSPIVYAENINDVIKGTAWQYSALHQFATRHDDATTNIYRYLHDYKEYPFIEYLVKLRLYRLVEEMTERSNYVHHINEKGKTLPEILGVGKEYLPLLQEIDATDTDLSLVQAASKTGHHLTADEYRAFVAKHGHNCALFKLTCYATLHRLTKYLEEQNCKRDMNNTFRDFCDYINYCEELEYDLKNEFILFPKALKEAHDIVYKRVLALRERKRKKYRKELDAKSGNHFAELQERYGWEYLGYVVIAPSSLFEIIKEGQKLHHCVGGSAERAAEGKTTILFLRKKDTPDVPFYTIEVGRDQVTQCRGRNNCSMTDEIEKVIKAFTKKKINPPAQRKVVVA